jgi:hypothetical protein
MNKQTTVVISLAAAHLLLVVCGAAGLSLLSGRSPPGKALRWYGAMSGADNGYGFFAPGVAPQWRATFTLSDTAGRTWTDTLEGDHNHEVAHRVGGIVNLFSEPGLRPELAASWAAKMFGRYPDAKQVVIRVEIYDLPTMAEYRNGTRPQWEFICEATFARHRAGSPGKEPSS